MLNYQRKNNLKTPLELNQRLEDLVNRRQKIEELIAILEAARAHPRMFFFEVQSYLFGFSVAVDLLDLKKEYFQTYAEVKKDLGHDYEQPFMYLKNVLKLSNAECSPIRTRNLETLTEAN